MIHRGTKGYCVRDTDYIENVIGTTWGHKDKNKMRGGENNPWEKKTLNHIDKKKKKKVFWKFHRIIAVGCLLMGCDVWHTFWWAYQIKVALWSLFYNLEYKI